MLMLRPLPRHQNIHRALQGAGGAPLREVNELITREQALRARHQHAQEIKLGIGDCHHGPGGVKNLAANGNSTYSSMASSNTNVSSLFLDKTA